MAKPRIFISSTFYDLRQVRSDLDNFIESVVMKLLEMKKVIYHTEKMRL